MQSNVAVSGPERLARASVILGIFWLVGLGSVFALYFGYASKRKIRDSRRGGDGVATAGLVLGYVGLAAAVFFFLAIAGVFSGPSKSHSFADGSLFSADDSQPLAREAAQVRSDLRNAATAEEAFLVDYDRYTNEATELWAEYLRLQPGTDLAIGTGPLDGYCLAASYAERGGWYLYDSKAFGLSATTFGSLTEAERACSVADALWSSPSNGQPFAHTPQPSVSDLPPLTDQDAQVRSDLRNAATAEETFLVDYDRYTTLLSNLKTEGFDPSSGTEIAIAAAGTDAYCLVGSHDGKGSWWLFDIRADGLREEAFSSAAQAEAACSMHGVTFSAPSSS